MTSISKGGNLAIEVPAVRAVLSWTSGPGLPDADASALLVGGSGTVGSDADFVFYNQPGHPSGCVAHLGKQPHADGRGIADAVHVDLSGLPAEVDRVVLAASTTDGTFGQLPDLRLDLVDAASNSPLAQFVLDAGDETALVTGELYRRNGQWKFRAVGQGYASGLAGLARDFGITVDEDTPAPAEPAEQKAASAAPEPPPTPQNDQQPVAPPPLPPQSDQQPVAPSPLPPQQPATPPPLPSQQPVAPPPLPPQQPVAPPPLPPQQPVAPPPLPPQNDQQPVAPPPLPPERPAAAPAPPPPPTQQAEPDPTDEQDTPEPPPLPHYDGPRPVIGQAYEPAPDGFAPPPPRR